MISLKFHGTWSWELTTAYIGWEPDISIRSGIILLLNTVRIMDWNYFR